MLIALDKRLRTTLANGIWLLWPALFRCFVETFRVGVVAIDDEVETRHTLRARQLVVLSTREEDTDFVDA